MAAIFQRTFSNAFSWMKIYEFKLRLQGSLFLRVKLTIFQHWFRWWLGANQATRHYLHQWWLDYWRIHIYVSFGLNELSVRFIANKIRVTFSNDGFWVVIYGLPEWKRTLNCYQPDELNSFSGNHQQRAPYCMLFVWYPCCFCVHILLYLSFCWK